MARANAPELPKGYTWERRKSEQKPTREVWDETEQPKPYIFPA